MKLRWRELCIAFLMALALWYSITGSEKIESQVKVRVEYKGAPAGLIIRDGLVNDLRVRVRASTGMLRSMADRDYVFSMDLSSLVKGRNVLPVTENQLPFRGGVEVIDITPSRIDLDVDAADTKKVPVSVELTGELPPDLVITTNLEPDEVTLRGPAGILADMRMVRLSLPVNGQTIPGDQTLKKALALPESVTATPAEVSATLHTTIKRKIVRVTREVLVEQPVGMNAWIRPDKVTVVVSVPESMADKILSSPDIVAQVILPKAELGTHNLPVHVSLPLEMDLIKVEPVQISVTLEQQETVIPPKRKK